MRRMGKMLNTQKENSGMNKGGMPTENLTNGMTGLIPTLSDIGISRDMFIQAQAIDEVSEVAHTAHHGHLLLAADTV
jgi:hypothetical protein